MLIGDYMYKFIINDFEGPLDLLLHLIKQSNINITDISIEEITKQYLNYTQTFLQCQEKLYLK